MSAPSMQHVTINTTAQWYAHRWLPKAFWDAVRKLLLHTTEGTDWPGYDGGAKAPNGTVKPDMQGKRLDVRQHFPWASSARALRNEPGGNETNAVPGGITQLELVGTCDPATSRKWQASGLKPDVDYIEWWRPPAWAIQALAELVVHLHHEVGVPLRLGSDHWVPYPDSYGTHAPQRLHGRAWIAALGIVGHQHADENEHGDPGAFPAKQLLAACLALTLLAPPVKPPASHPPVPAPRPAPPSPTEDTMAGGPALYIRKPGKPGVALVTSGLLVPITRDQAERWGVNLATYPAGDVRELDATSPLWSLPSANEHLAG